MADWVDRFKPYAAVNDLEVRTGTVFRRVPFAATLLGSTAFGLADVPKGTGSVPPTRVDLALLQPGGEAIRTDNVTIEPGVVMTADCDIFQHKCNTLCVARMVAPERFIELNCLRQEKAENLRKAIRRARIENPATFNFPGLFLLLGDPAFAFEDAIILLDSFISLPIEFATGAPPGSIVTADSIGGRDNAWFRVSHPELRIRMVNEFARQLLRVGLADA